ncbi:MAG TPA: putative metal-binding motif-containing protein [Polyangiaceae bacterium]|nr:putative metal-binding motif-containing protein [Polyangiaceae bacterium]
MARRAWSVALFAAAHGISLPAAARAGGIVTRNCDGCHGGAASVAPALTLTADPPGFGPGDLVTLTLSIRTPGLQVGGAFVTTAGIGALRALPGEGLGERSQGLAHTAPKAAVNGAVTFRFGWQTPSQPGAVDFAVAALAGNGNNAPTGDAPGSAEFQWVFGCEPRTFYRDLDRDGYGAEALGVRLGCSTDAAPEGYAAFNGDCDENSEDVHPGTKELCNKRDDNCDGQSDENAPPAMMWPDGDGDGYYALATGTAQLGCGNVPGYAAAGGDCDDANPLVHPGAIESCNNRDDDCDGELDELVRPQCGVGWCSRYSASCNPADCRPGAPAPETCNRFDDDCDGEDDNGTCSESPLGRGGSPASAGSAPSSAGSEPAATPPGGGCSVVTRPGRVISSWRLTALALTISALRLAASRRIRKRVPRS